MEIQDFSHHLKGIEAAVKRQLERDLPKKLGNLAVRMSKENFQKESFFGCAWKEVKRRHQGDRGAAGHRKIVLILVWWEEGLEVQSVLFRVLAEPHYRNVHWTFRHPCFVGMWSFS